MTTHEDREPEWLPTTPGELIKLGPPISQTRAAQPKQQLAYLYGVPAELLEPTAEEVELRNREAKYRAELPDRMDQAAADATQAGHAVGWLPADMTLEAK